MGTLNDLIQGTSKGFWAGGAGAPVDALTLALNSLIAGGGYAGHKMGLLNNPPDLIEKPVGGSEWIADKMRSRGLLADNPGSTADNIGNVLGGLLGPVTAAKAPQIARGLLQVGENAMAPTTLSKEAGMALFDTGNLPDRGRGLIQAKSQELAKQLEQNGFKVELQHSGSAAGPSSYLKVFDPTTGRYFDDVRMSGHSKGAFNSAGVTNVASDEEMANVVERALKMRDLGKSSGMKFQENIEVTARKLIESGVKPKTAYSIARKDLISDK